MSKGRVSNELVAAGCAAVLTVYAAGYWRTRDVARQLEVQAQERRPSRPAMPAPAPMIEPAPAPADEIAAEPVADVPEPVAATPAPEKPAAVEKPAPKIAKSKANPPAEVKPAAEKPPAIQSIPLVEPPEPTLAAAIAKSIGVTPTGQWRDGTFTGWGNSYHGDIEAKVVIEGGRIVDAGVATCGTRYPCDVIHTILFQPIERQSADVDRVSRATESADAYYYGLMDALSKAIAAPETPASSPQ
ncbi:MAG: hypothetical protein ABW136_12125 [Steroidobacteraceae bacterium]